MTDLELMDVSADARGKSYAPYSTFAVGAALLSGVGRVFTGCNVENVSYGLTMCAERVAVGSAVSQGVVDFRLLALTGDSKEPVVPCGACRQVLAEFSPNLRILSSTLSGESTEFRLDVLLPAARQGILG